MSALARIFLPVFVLCVALLAGAVSAQETVTYRVEIKLDWQTGALGPEDPHWSRVIVFSHAAAYSLFADGDTASSGLALVATNGRVSVLQAELAEARRRNRAGDPVVLPGSDTGQAAFSLTLDLTERMRHVAFATMLAPSPDWFTGASGVALHDGTDWLDTVVVPLWVWDAGADSGADFVAANAPTQPRQSVRLLTHPAFLTDSGLKPIGQLTISRQE